MKLFQGVDDWILSRLARGLPQRRFKKVIRTILRHFSEQTDELAAVAYRPKFNDGFQLPNASYDLSGRRVAVVIQGPIAARDAFTLETIKIYLRQSDIRWIILSTWDTEAPEAIQEIRDLGVEVVLSPCPVIKGISNINFQVASSMAGLRRAKDLGATHALKTRTDQRLYRPNFISLMLALGDTFPCGSHAGHAERIQVSSMNSYAYRPYSLSDMLVFGAMEDLLRYWDLPLNPGPREKVDYNALTLRGLLDVQSAEILILENFMRALGKPIQQTLEDYHDIVQEHFIIMDQDMVEQVWQKNTTGLEWADRIYKRHSAYANWSFLLWLTQQRFRRMGAKVPCDLDKTRVFGDVVL